jgi:hypothetical protein
MLMLLALTRSAVATAAPAAAATAKEVQLLQSAWLLGGLSSCRPPVSTGLRLLWLVGEVAINKSSQLKFPSTFTCGTSPAEHSTPAVGVHTWRRMRLRRGRCWRRVANTDLTPDPAWLEDSTGSEVMSPWPVVQQQQQHHQQQQQQQQRCRDVSSSRRTVWWGAEGPAEGYVCTGGVLLQGRGTGV